MFKVIFTAIAFICYAGIANAQTDTLICDYPDRNTAEAESLPWFGNNNLHYHLFKGMKNKYLV